MAIIVACSLFVLVALLGRRYYPRLPRFIKNNLELYLVVVGFIGVLAAISEISADTKKTKSLELVNEAEEMFGFMMQRIEYRMDACGVWWDVALDQTNKEPQACKQNEDCENTCRIAHFVSQYRWSPIDIQLEEEWRNFKMLICDSPDIGKGENKVDPLCPYAVKFYEALEKANESKLEADSQPFSNKVVLIIVQFLLAIGLGLEVVKLRNSKKS